MKHLKRLTLTLGSIIAMSASSHNAAAAQDQLKLTLSNGGEVIVDFREDLAPNHVERIKTLTRDGFYDGVIFHRVLDGFMAQTGDPTGTGRGGSDYPDLKAEFSSEADFQRGSMAMARSSNPDSANSQFFICFTDTGCDHLKGGYTLWGQVVDGMEAVDRLERGVPPQNPDSIVNAEIMSGSQTQE